MVVIEIGARSNAKMVSMYTNFLDSCAEQLLIRIISIFAAHQVHGLTDTSAACPKQ